MGRYSLVIYVQVLRKQGSMVPLYLNGFAGGADRFYETFLDEGQFTLAEMKQKVQDLRRCLGSQDTDDDHYGSFLKDIDRLFHLFDDENTRDMMFDVASFKQP